MSCAYSGRIAVAYRYGDIRAQPNHPEEKFINLYVAIFECESTGAFFFLSFKRSTENMSDKLALYST